MVDVGETGKGGSEPAVKTKSGKIFGNPAGRRPQGQGVVSRTLSTQKGDISTDKYRCWREVDLGGKLAMPGRGWGGKTVKKPCQKKIDPVTYSLSSRIPEKGSEGTHEYREVFGQGKLPGKAGSTLGWTWCCGLVFSGAGQQYWGVQKRSRGREGGKMVRSSEFCASHQEMKRETTTEKAKWTTVSGEHKGC